MSKTSQTSHGHESVDHVAPVSAGMMDPDPARQPATGVMGDETLVRLDGEGFPPYPGIEGGEDRRGRDPKPGPTRWERRSPEPGKRNA